MDIVEKLRAMGGYLDYDCEVPLSFIADEIQTLRAKVASAEVLVEALREARQLVMDINGKRYEFIDEALATYDKLSEGKHDTK